MDQVNITPMARARENRLKTYGLLSLCLALGTMASSQPITSQNTLTPEQLVNTILLGQGVTASNVLFNGQPANTVNDQVVAYQTGTSNIGLVLNPAVCLR